jgi:subtilase family serine protease
VAAQAQLYGLTGAWANGDTGVGQTIAVYELGVVDTADTNVFFSCYHLTPSLTTVSVDGGATGAFNDEATMDVEEAAALAPGAALQVYSGPNTSSGPVDIYSRIANDNTATIVTTSWGDCEIDPAGATTAENQIFQQMAAQGQTVIAAAGDAGSSDCVGITSKSPVPSVDDPASQPLVTGVGALTVNSISPLQESVWNTGPNSASGGGQSVLWSRPSWQVAPGISGSLKGRLVPDLSVMGDPGTGFIQYFTGNSTGTVTCTSSCSAGWGAIGGTSIGAPLVSALVATAAQVCGTSRLGLINPTLYSIYSSGTAYADVTTGSNDAYAGRPGDPHVYSAGPGFDLASGLGSPTPSFISQLCPTPPAQTRVQSYVSSSATVGTGAVLSLSLRTPAGGALGNAQIVVTATSSAGGTPGIDAPASRSGSGTNSVTVTTDPHGFVHIDVSSLVAARITVTVALQGTTLVTKSVTFKAVPPTRQIPARVVVTSLRPVPQGLTLNVAAPAAGTAPVSRYQVSVTNGRVWISFSPVTRNVTLRSLRPGTSYDVVVRALNANGNSPWTRVGPIAAGH